MWQVSPGGAISIFQTPFFSFFLYLSMKLTIHSWKDILIFFNLHYVQLCVKGALLSQGKFAVCLDLILKSVFQGELLIVIPILVMS